MSEFENNVRDLRREYSKHQLDISDVDPDPLKQFTQWFNEAIRTEVTEPNAMTLSTADEQGKPCSRVVLLKDVSEGGFTFYTNYNSRKAKNMAVNPYVSLNFFWPELERQVRIDGRTEKVPESVSDDYFASRPRESRLGAIASLQSEPLNTRDDLEKRYFELLKEYDNKEIPRPTHWGGYRVKPYRVEFWQGRPSRMHDRIVYEHSNAQWIITRLYP
jgi:pyridoxamine 5'-phosphate oxidase